MADIQWKSVTRPNASEYFPKKVAERKEGDAVVGTFVTTTEVTSPDGTKGLLYQLKAEDGHIIGVNDSAALRGKFDTIAPGDLVRVEFLGKKVSNKTGRSYNDFDVQVAESNPDSKEGFDAMKPAGFTEPSF